MKPRAMAERGRVARRGLNAFVRRAGGHAYLVLAVVFSLAIIADTGVTGMLNAAEIRLFDFLVSHRFSVPPADRDIVIVDIDEASLAAMAPRHGRWPWANEVFGRFVAAVEAQGPQAIVFDILFADRDTLRPRSDEAFNATIAASRTTFFPMLRLDPQNDHLSRIQPGMLPGVRPLGDPARADAQATIAVILPKVPAAIDNGRLGTHQVDPDRDGVVRRFPSWIEHAGWRIPSLPARIAEEFAFPGATQREVLLNWRGPPFTYRYVPFADLYRDLVEGAGTRPASEFRNKILVIGSTAPSLFDIKGTPVARIHPGVEILATAIDNFKHGDWLRERPRWLMVGAALALIWGMATALYLRVRIQVFDSLFGGLQAGLVSVAYLTLNFSHWYLDVSAPLSLGLAYFTVARLYHGFSTRSLANGPVDDLATLQTGQRRLAVLAIRLDGATPGERRRLLRQIDRLVARSKSGVARIADIIEDPGIVRSAFAEFVMLYWLAAEEAADYVTEMDAAEAVLRSAEPQARWGERLRFGREVADVRWENSGGWRAGARTAILDALKAAANDADKERVTP